MLKEDKEIQYLKGVRTEQSKIIKHSAEYLLCKI